MNNQSANLAKRMQLEETLLKEREIFKSDVILYTSIREKMTDLEMDYHKLGLKINIQRNTIKSYEMDIELLNKVNKELDNKQEEKFLKGE